MFASNPVQTLFRYSGTDTLDEPVTTTIVSAATLTPSYELTPGPGTRLAFDILEVGACSLPS
jgi:hypothetical protein